MHKPSAVLFADSQAETPIVFGANSSPRTPNQPALIFNFDTGRISLTKGLIVLSAIETHRYVYLVNFKNHSYLTCLDVPSINGTFGHWSNLQSKGRWGIVSAFIQSKTFAQWALRSLGYLPGDVIQFPVADYTVSAEEIGLDPTVYSRPFYRIAKDQPTRKKQ